MDKIEGRKVWIVKLLKPWDSLSLSLSLSLKMFSPVFDMARGSLNPLPSDFFQFPVLLSLERHPERKRWNLAIPVTSRVVSAHTRRDFLSVAMVHAYNEFTLLLVLVFFWTEKFIGNQKGISILTFLELELFLFWNQLKAKKKKWTKISLVN